MNALLRPVPIDSPVHRMWAGTKVVGLTFIGLVTMWWPSWFTLAGTAIIALLTFAVARLPWTVFPKPPRPLLIVFAFSAVLSTVGNGFMIWLRFAGFSLVMLLLVGLLGWTTPLSELPPALTKLLRPLRRIGVPAEELASVLALTIRLLPILADETRVTMAARRVRSVSQVATGPKSTTDLLGEGMDLGVTLLTSAMRRSRELGVALRVRGTSPGPTPDVKLSRVDLVAFLLVVIFVVTVAAVEL